VLRKLAEQVARLLQRLQLERVQRVEDAPALAVKGGDARALGGEGGAEVGEEGLVVAPDLDLQSLWVVRRRREVVVDLSRVRHGLEPLPDGRERARQ
jgi:hypothetical protein